MAATLTLTGTAGPGTTVTAVVYTGVHSFTVNTANNVIQMNFVESGGSPVFVSVNAAATVTATKSGFTWTVTVS